MKQRMFGTALTGLLLVAFAMDATAASTSRLITQDDAARHGLTRAWFAQIPLDPGRSQISHLRLFEGTGPLPDTLLVQTNQATVHAINAETGQTLWTRLVGSPAHPTMPVGACRELVAVVNGNKLYLLDRASGRLLWDRRIEGVPADGPVLTDRYAVVPTVGGLVVAYPIAKEEFEPVDALAGKPTATAEKENETPESGSASPNVEPTTPKPAAKEPYRPFTLKQDFIYPLTCVSFGRVTSQPIFVLEDNQNQYLAWATTRGLFVGYIDLQREREFAVKYQVRTKSDIVTPPTYLPPNLAEEETEGLIFSASSAGAIYAVSATRGVDVWRYALGEPVVEPIVPIRNRVYITTQLGNFFCLDATTGMQRWSTRNVSQFIAASRQRIYVADRAGQVSVLDADSGTRVDGFFASDLPIKFRNLWTDRIYLATPSGLVQCLHETTQAEPLWHQRIEHVRVEAVPGQEPAAGEKPTQPEEKPAAEPEPSGENPFDAPASGDNPFGE